MADDFVQLPLDTSNTGKKVRTNTRTVGANSVHEHYTIIQDITNNDQARVLTVAPTTEAGVVTRNIPSGTQPVSGTVTANAGTNLNTSTLATSAKQPALGTAGVASADVITVQGVASMIKLLVTPDSVALPANQSTNINQVGGAAITEGQKAMAASVPVVVASDQSAIPISGTITDNQGTALPQTGAGWPVQPWGMTDTLFASGQTAGAAAGTAICTLTTPPAGTYRIDFTCGMVTGTSASDNNNIELRKGATPQLSFLGGMMGITGAGNQQMLQSSMQNIRMTLDGATSVSLNMTLIGTATTTYIGQIIATRIF